MTVLLLALFFSFRSNSACAEKKGCSYNKGLPPSGMAGEKCEHCLGLERIKTWKIGITELTICSECAEDIIKMHQEMSEWVGL